jgi:hypothetical protein
MQALNLMYYRTKRMARRSYFLINRCLDMLPPWLDLLIVSFFFAFFWYFVLTPPIEFVMGLIYD